MKQKYWAMQAPGTAERLHECASFKVCVQIPVLFKQEELANQWTTCQLYYNCQAAYERITMTHLRGLASL